MNPEIIIDGQEIISFGYSDYLISGTQELIEIEPSDWPVGARKKDVYWDGSKVVLKTQAMIDTENQIKQDKEDKEELDNRILKELPDILYEMISNSDSEFNFLIESLKTGVIE